MLNRKFASIRANVKTDKRESFVQNDHQRFHQSRSMDINTSSQRKNNIFVNVTKDTAWQPISQGRKNLEFDDTHTETPVRSPITKLPAPHHPYVNLMHQNFFNSVSNSPYQLQYQNASPSSTDSWSLQNQTNHIPQVTPFSTAPIYMIAKENANQQTLPSYSMASKKMPPEIPKRLSSSTSAGPTSNLRKTNGLLRSS